MKPRIKHPFPHLLFLTVCNTLNIPNVWANPNHTDYCLLYLILLCWDFIHQFWYEEACKERCKGKLVKSIPCLFYFIYIFSLPSKCLQHCVAQLTKSTNGQTVWTSFRALEMFSIRYRGIFRHPTFFLIRHPTLGSKIGWHPTFNIARTSQGHRSQ